jgi:hypothetical protein
MKNRRHHLRLDDETDKALGELCHRTAATKSALMRRYVQEGVRTEAMNREVSTSVHGSGAGRAPAQKPFVKQS